MDTSLMVRTFVFDLESGCQETSLVKYKENDLNNERRVVKWNSK